ncbi:MAG: hypothetical protein JWR50_3606 [Mucilaginibacter sp.]|nr:hypothetical protein [Mucilaginibacter sp.]
MKVQYLSFSIFLSLLFGIFSCKKDNGAKTNITFPRELYPTQITQKGEVKVYTAGGEMTDASQKEKFLGAQKTSFNLTFQPNVTTSQVLNSSITFVNRDTMMFSLSPEKYVAANKNGQFTFTGTKYQLPVDTADILYKSLKYDYLLIKAPFLPSGQPYSGPGVYFSNNLTYNTNMPFLGKPVSVGYGDYNTLRLSLFSFKFSRKLISGLNISYYSESGFLYNEFNSTVISKLKSNDTLAIQECFLTLKSK